MANTKVSQLPEYTGNTYNGYVIWNDSGETTTYKTLYQPQFIKGTGASGYRTPTALANGDNAISIGATDASGANDIMIGSGANYTSSNNSIGIGRGLYMLASPYGINIGENCANQGSYTIVIGSTYGGRTSRSMAEAAITIGNGNQNNEGYRGVILGNLNGIGPGTNYNVVIGNNSRVDGGSHNTIIGGENNNISGGTSGTTLIGLSNFTSPTENDTTYTQNHKSLGQSYNGYFDNGSGDTFTIDWNNGNSQKIFMTGDISLTFTNVKSGGQYRLQIVNGGTHSITATTASGFTILCEGGVVPNITNNGVDLCILEGMGTDLLVRHFAGFAAP
jgi:hypothetical protein